MDLSSTSHGFSELLLKVIKAIIITHPQQQHARCQLHIAYAKELNPTAKMPCMTAEEPCLTEKEPSSCTPAGANGGSAR